MTLHFYLYTARSYSNSIVSTICCVLYFLYALYFVFLFCIFHHFHEFLKNFADKMTTLYLNFTSHLLRRTSQKTAWFEIISSIGLIGSNGLIYPNQLICKLKNTITLKTKIELYFSAQPSQNEFVFLCNVILHVQMPVVNNQF